MNAEKIMRHANWRSLFLVMVVLAVIICIGTRVWLVPQLEPTEALSWGKGLGLIIDNIFVSVVVTVGLSAIAIWLFPDLEEIAKIRVIEHREIGNILEKAMNKTDRWWFQGATGRYLRTTALDRLIECCNRSGGGCQVMAMLIDPTNERLCASYAKYRLSLRDGINWTGELVQIEVIATIIKALNAQAANAQLNIEVYLRDTFCTFRYDMSSSSLVITKELGNAPALKCDHGGHYYDAYQGEMMFARSQARKVENLPDDLGRVPLDEPAIAQLLTVLKIKPSKYTPEMGNAIATKLADPHNPYKAGNK